MNDYIERYIYDVTKRLDEKQREDISKELEANIYDMLGEDQSTENIKTVLTTLGSPAKMAMNYKEPRYLISPELFDDYKHVLVIVVAVFVGISFAIGIIEAVTATGIAILEGVFETLFGSVISAGFNGFAVTTLIFAGIELYRKKVNPPFRVESLPKIPKVESKKNLRVEMIIESVFAVIFGYIFIHVLLTNYVNINAIWDEVTWIYTGSVLNAWVANLFVPWFIAYLVLTVIIKVFQFKEGGFTKVLGIFYTALELTSLVIMSIVFTRMNTFNPLFVQSVSTAFNIDFAYHLDLAVKGIISMVWIITTIELIVTWYKIYHPKKGLPKQKN
ncbi:hypothetical protein [Paracholeplasma manati]|uniref:Uncharacterized protein n=1 Tax=Paracholeplasma manati TaxID=591373 RepID=A0ABT2Y762_9MOLU|nr:hypothetical protein [Paracholeplasma manati]MCV2232582.1 hypothetical protein [Paracholeplasma manati]MDG0889075.1 hypothetical protein [Paracholeplasma manati]